MADPIDDEELNYEERWLEKLESSAARGEPFACMELYDLYSEGSRSSGIRKDENKAREFLEKAARYRHAEAAFMLGNELLLSAEEATGELARESKAEDAYRWLRVAADQGHERALIRLYQLAGQSDYYGVFIDPEDHYKWLRTGAQQGIPRMQEYLGEIYRQGTEVPQDLERAYYWSALASAQYPDAELKSRASQLRDEIASQLPPKKVLKAQRALRSWKPRPSDWQYVEEEHNWHIPADFEGDGILGDGTLARVWRHMKNRVRSKSRMQRIDPQKHGERITEAADILEQLLWSLHPDANQFAEPEDAKDVVQRKRREVWGHQPLSELNSTAADRSSPYAYTPVDTGGIIRAAAGYLQYPHLRSNYLDWAIVDALLFDELFTWYRGILDGSALGEVNWTFLMANEDVGREALYRLAWRLFRGFTSLILPPVIALGLWWYGLPLWAIGAVGVWLMGILIWVVRWPIRRRRHRARQREFEKADEIFRAFVEAYERLNPHVMSPALVKGSLNKVTQTKGAILSPTIYAIVDRMLQEEGQYVCPLAEL